VSAPLLAAEIAGLLEDETSSEPEKSEIAASQGPLFPSVV